MKQKNLPDDIESKSLDELKEILNNLVEKIEKNKVSNQSEEDYLEIFKFVDDYNRIFSNKIFKKLHFHAFERLFQSLSQFLQLD